MALIKSKITGALSKEACTHASRLDPYIKMKFPEVSDVRFIEGAA
jgi:hypothetical protein